MPLLEGLRPYAHLSSDSVADHLSHMHVGFDASAQGARTTGAGEYQRQLVAALPGVDPGLELTVYTPRGLGWAVTGRATLREMPWSAGDRTRRILQGGLIWRRRWREDRLDLLHVPFYYLPAGAPRRSVVTVYDVRFLRFPETYPRARLSFMRAAVPWSLRRAAHIIAISEFTKAELVELLGLDPARISVTLLAPREQFRREEDPATLAAARQKYQLPAQFIFSAGTLEPRKNLIRVVEAFARLRARGMPHELVLAGFRYYQSGALDEAIARYGVASAVHLIGYVDDADMAALYSMASAFVYPSLYEGFGIPPLEAMACGTPVVAAAATSIPEVVGEAARLVDPRNVGDIEAGLSEVLEDPARAAWLCAAGFERLRRFSWAQTARDTLQVYHRVLGGA